MNDFRLFPTQFPTNCHEILQALFSTTLKISRIVVWRTRPEESTLWWRRPPLLFLRCQVNWMLFLQWRILRLLWRQVDVVLMVMLIYRPIYYVHLTISNKIWPKADLTLATNLKRCLNARQRFVINIQRRDIKTLLETTLVLQRTNVWGVVPMLGQYFVEYLIGDCHKPAKSYI